VQSDTAVPNVCAAAFAFRTQALFGWSCFLYSVADITVAETYKNNFLGTWTKLGAIKKPIIGAVSGYAVRPLLSF
jgi:hypothetical protein